MKTKHPFTKIKTHWTTAIIIKGGCLLALLLLLYGFTTERGSYMAIAICQTSVYLFAISVIGGLLLDVIAVKKGMKEK